MPIPDPGNASQSRERLRPGRVPILDDDRRRRVTALGVALATGLALLPAVIATTITGEWRWFFGGMGAWVTLSVIASCYATYRYGRRP